MEKEFRRKPVLTGVHASEQKERSKKVFGGLVASAALPFHMADARFVKEHAPNSILAGIFSFIKND